MQKNLFALSAVLVSGFLFAQESVIEPILNYDYTSGTLACGGRFQAPIITGETVVRKGTTGSIRFDGKTNFMTVPGGTALSLKNGGTLFALVRLAEEDGLGMLYFKADEFLFGFYRGGKLYFNIKSRKSKKFDRPFHVEGIRRGEWHTVAAALQRWENGSWTVFLYIDGVRKGSKTFQLTDGYSETENRLIIGRGWNNWRLNGDVGILQIYDVRLNDSQIRDLSQKVLPHKQDRHISSQSAP